MPAIASPKVEGGGWFNEDGVATFEPPPSYRGDKHTFEARSEGDDCSRPSSDRGNT